MHQAWFPPELADARMARMNAYLYHLRMIDRADRETRYEKFRIADPNNEHQRIGYDHLIDETDLALKPVLPWRKFADLLADGSRVQMVRKPAAGTQGVGRFPDSEEFDELFYLNENDDVRRSVLRGDLSSGWEHFQQRGAWEGRRWRIRAGLAGYDFGEIFRRLREARS